VQIHKSTPLLRSIFSLKLQWTKVSCRLKSLVFLSTQTTL